MTRNNATGDDETPVLSRRWSLRARILAVNLFAVLMLAGGVLYLGSFRDRLLDHHTQEVAAQAELLATALATIDGMSPTRFDRALPDRFGAITGARVRIYTENGAQQFDSWAGSPPTFVLRDPDSEPFGKHAARFLDQLIEGLAGRRRLESYSEPAPDRRSAWPEAEEAFTGQKTRTRNRFAPDRTVIISAVAPMPGGRVLMLTSDATDVTRDVRAERFTLFMIFLGVLVLTLLMSSFLARTIVRPLKRLSLAAQRVRLGRAREVTIPRFQKRGDEIGVLSRTLSDMTAALRHKIDATEAFAADVAHEIKNPLASLRSAVDGLGNVDDPELRAQLLGVVRDDVSRIDRLISDISDASRLDAELSRARFEAVDIGDMVATLVALYQHQGLERDITIAANVPAAGTARALGDEGRLAQVVRNLVDNAISFSPDSGRVDIGVSLGLQNVIITVEDRGPGIPDEALGRVFERFYSERPEASFGKHSGLGLAIVKAILDAHDGSILAENLVRDGNRHGARFTVEIPAARGFAARGRA